MALDPEVKRRIEKQAEESIKAMEGAIGQTTHPVSISVRRDFIEKIKAKRDEMLAMADQKNVPPEQSAVFAEALKVDAAGPGWSPTGQQAFDEYMTLEAQRGKQNQQLTDFRNKSETQMFGRVGGTLQDALSAPGSELGQLSEILKQQQSGVFNQEMKPLIDQGLASQGLFDSGARVEQQAKALGGLERNRQQTLLQAALGGREQLRGLERQDILGDVGNQQAALQNVFDLQRTGITMEFQRQLERERAALAQSLSQRKGSNGLGGILGAVGGGLAGFAIGGPPGAMVGSTLGGALGGQFGGGDAVQGGAFGASFGTAYGGMRSPSPTTASPSGPGPWRSGYGDPYGYQPGYTLTGGR